MALYEIAMIVLGTLMLIAGAIDGATNHDYAHGCYDLLVGALCLGWLKYKSK